MATRPPDESSGHTDGLSAQHPVYGTSPTGGLSWLEFLAVQIADQLRALTSPATVETSRARAANALAALTAGPTTISNVLAAAAVLRALEAIG